MAAPVVTAPVLNELKVLVTFGGATAMIPSFAPDIFNYSLSVQSDISTVGILPASDPAARYTIQVNDMDLIAGITSKVDLAVGDNTIKVAVADTHHATRVYMLHVSRENIQPVASKFLKAGFSDTATGIAMSYRLFVPDSYDPARFYPLLLFLHGAGERGSDNEIQLLANQGATVWAKPEQQSRHSCFVLAPQCPWDPSADSARAPYGKGGWTSLIPNGFTDPYKARPELETAFDILQSVSRTYSIDKKRIYCTGLSMGGFGTWAIAISHPDTFAALVVIARGRRPRPGCHCGQHPKLDFSCGQGSHCVHQVCGDYSPGIDQCGGQDEVHRIFRRPLFLSGGSFVLDPRIRQRRNERMAVSTVPISLFFQAELWQCRRGGEIEG